MKTSLTTATLLAGIAVLELGIAPPSPKVARAPCRTRSIPMATWRRPTHKLVGAITADDPVFAEHPHVARQAHWCRGQVLTLRSSQVGTSHRYSRLKR